MPKATNTRTEYVILLAVPLQQWMHKRTSMVRYTYTSRLAELTMVLFFFFKSCLERARLQA
jgi:hypothetical protein